MNTTDDAPYWELKPRYVVNGEKPDWVKASDKFHSDRKKRILDAAREAVKESELDISDYDLMLAVASKLSKDDGDMIRRNYDNWIPYTTTVSAAKRNKRIKNFNVMEFLSFLFK